jgi:hypothetical protein
MHSAAQLQATNGNANPFLRNTMLKAVPTSDAMYDARFWVIAFHSRMLLGDRFSFEDTIGCPLS